MFWRSNPILEGEFKGESTFLNGEGKKIKQYLEIDLSEGGLNLFLTGGMF